MKISVRSFLCALTLMFAFNLSAMAQTASDSTHSATVHTSNYHDNDDHSNWGLLGLVGLLGLAGLSRRRPVEARTEYRNPPVR